MTDRQLLREYVDTKSEAAFRRLVDRHMKLVYGTCRRALADSQPAEDATQAVFLLLAQKASSLRNNVSIAGWLFTAARLISRNVARGEARRRDMEERAARDMEHRSVEPGWLDIEPWLDEGLAALPAADRELILMRYFDELSCQEIALQSRTAENTVAKRTSRAIEKLRRGLQRNGVAITWIGLSVLLDEFRPEAAPETCVAGTMQAVHSLTVSPSALGAAARAALLHKGVYFTMQATRYKIVIAGAVTLFVVAGVGIPIAVLRAQQTGVTNAQIPTVTVTDPAAGSLPAGDPTQSARAEIEQDMRVKTEDEIRRRADTVEPWDTPNNAAYAVEGGARVQTDKYRVYGGKNILLDMTAAGLAHSAVTSRITSFAMANGHVKLTYHCTFGGTSTSNKDDPSVPIGTLMQIDEDVQDEWQRINDRWMHVGPEQDRPNTATQSKDGHGVVVDISGPPDVKKPVVRKF
jgi:RNA polymerase sigma factor (sigma-70 family)